MALSAKSCALSTGSSFAFKSSVTPSSTNFPIIRVESPSVVGGSAESGLEMAT